VLNGRSRIRTTAHSYGLHWHRSSQPPLGGLAKLESDEETGNHRNRSEEVETRETAQSEAKEFVVTVRSIVEELEPAKAPGEVIFSDSGRILLSSHRNGKYTELAGRAAQTSNNQVELTAAIQALQASPLGVGFLVMTDSEYAFKWVTI
jgi:hypothetical protein